MTWDTSKQLRERVAGFDPGATDVVNRTAGPDIPGELDGKMSRLG